jgi:hypothetical protein
VACHECQGQQDGSVDFPHDETGKSDSDTLQQLAFRFF